MKKTYIRPLMEIIAPKYSDIMQGINIPISGGTTPEESDAKQFLFNEDEDLDYYDNETDYINWPSVNLWRD